MTVKERTLTEEEAEEYIYGENVAIQDVEKHRWYMKQLVVFKDGDDLLGFYYLDPLTEMQEGGDRFEADPVPVFPVATKEVTTVVYEAAS